MSKSNGFAPTPLGSRPSSPPTGSQPDQDRQAMLMGPLGSKVAHAGEGTPPSTREQGESSVAIGGCFR